MATSCRLQSKPPIETKTWLGVFHSPVGWLQYQGQGDVLTRLDYCRQRAKTKSQAQQHPAEKQLLAQLKAYFTHANHHFHLPLFTSGTPFQQRVWQALLNIPIGETRTYGELAKTVDSAAQAVGQALKANPISIIIPCHRVVARTGLGGYGGAVNGVKLDRKAWLLTHEGADGGTDGVKS